MVCAAVPMLYLQTSQLCSPTVLSLCLFPTLPSGTGIAPEAGKNDLRVRRAERQQPVQVAEAEVEVEVEGTTSNARRDDGSRVILYAADSRRYSFYALSILKTSIN